MTLKFKIYLKGSYYIIAEHLRVILAIIRDLKAAVSNTKQTLWLNQLQGILQK